MNFQIPAWVLAWWLAVCVQATIVHCEKWKKPDKSLTKIQASLFMAAWVADLLCIWATAPVLSSMFR